MTDTTLDPKILNKNLEITRILKDLDDLKSDYVELKEILDDEINAKQIAQKTSDEFQAKYYHLRNELKELKEKYNTKILDERDALNQVVDLTREQTPMHMLQTLETCYSILNDETVSVQVLKDLREVIKFLQK
jgi:predicted nuclease with TOPRIM domain